MAASLVRIGILLVLGGCAARHPAEVDDFRHLLEAEGGTPQGSLVLTFFEVGLGDAILVELPSGGTILVDAGVGWQVEAILNYLVARGIEHLDVLLLTHPHLDHYGGMRAVVEAVHVEQFVHNGVDPKSPEFTELLAALRERSVPIHVVRRGSRLPGIEDPTVDISILYPDDEAIGRGGDLNRGSIVLRLTHGSVTILLAADAEHGEERRLLELEGSRLSADVLKLGHHASPLSGSVSFLAAVSPRLAIAQGTETVDVPFWYPRPSVRLERLLESWGIVFLTTGDEGTVQVVSDGTTVRWRSMARHGP